MVLQQQAWQPLASACLRILRRFWRKGDLKNTAAVLFGATPPCFGSQQRLKSWRPTFGCNTTNLEESRTTSFLAEVGLATQHTQRHLRCSTPTWHSTFMTTQMMSSPTRIS